MARKLLVPLDGSVLGEVAVPWAILLARSQGYTLVLCQAIPWPLIASDGMMGGYMSPNIYEDILETEREVADEYLNGVGSRLAEQGLNVEITVREGAPMTVLLDLADELGVDAIVMATHGRGGLPRLVLGSVANHVVQHATIPVLLVRADDTATARPPAFDRLLVPLDGSTLAERALDYATEIARPGSTAVLIRVEEPAPAPRDGEGKAVPERPSHDDVQSPASTYLHVIAEAAMSKGLQVDTDIRQGRPAEQILAAGRAHEVDIIVMATHGRGGPARWLLGSVADEVVRHADLPVLLVSARAIVARASEPYTIGDLLTTEPVTVREDESLAVVLRKLLRQRVSGVGVVNAGGDLIGIVSEQELTDWHDEVVSDLAQQEAPDPGEYARRLQAQTAASIMTRPTPALDASAPVGRATHLFRERGIARLPVTRDGKLVGILTRADILKAMAARLQATTGIENPSD